MLFLLVNDHLLFSGLACPRALDVSDGAGVARGGNARWLPVPDDPPLPSTGCPTGPDTMLDLAEAKRPGVSSPCGLMVDTSLRTLLLLFSRTKVGSQPLWTSLMSAVQTVLSTLKHLTSPLSLLFGFSGGTSGIVSEVLRVLVVMMGPYEASDSMWRLCGGRSARSAATSATTLKKLTRGLAACALRGFPSSSSSAWVLDRIP
jgi:hypothetical protein